MQPDTRYAKSGDVHVAYQVFGEGPVNLVFAPPFVSNVENYWDEPDFARWLLRLASYTRVVMFDKRGTGMSDRAAELPGLDQLWTTCERSWKPPAWRKPRCSAYRKEAR
jgi:pimeloyl-ACP methyl ester carboxylesterase